MHYVNGNPESDDFSRISESHGLFILICRSCWITFDVIRQNRTDLKSSFCFEDSAPIIKISIWQKNHEIWRGIQQRYFKDLRNGSSFCPFWMLCTNLSIIYAQNSMNYWIYSLYWWVNHTQIIWANYSNFSWNSVSFCINHEFSQVVNIF